MTTITHGRPRLVERDVQAGLDCLQSASTTPTTGRMTEPENSLGVLFRGRSVETSPEDRGMLRAAKARPLPHKYDQLAKGAQVNEPQHSDACRAYPSQLPQNGITK